MLLSGCATFDISSMPATDPTSLNLPVVLDLENTFNYETQHDFYWETVEFVVSYPIKSSATAFSAWYWGYFTGLHSRNAANAKAWQAAIGELRYHLDHDSEMIRLRCKSNH